MLFVMFGQILSVHNVVAAQLPASRKLTKQKSKNDLQTAVYAVGCRLGTAFIEKAFGHNFTVAKDIANLEGAIDPKNTDLLNRINRAIDAYIEVHDSEGLMNLVHVCYQKKIKISDIPATKANDYLHEALNTKIEDEKKVAVRLRQAMDERLQQSIMAVGNLKRAIDCCSIWGHLSKSAIAAGAVSVLENTYNELRVRPYVHMNDDSESDSESTLNDDDGEEEAKSGPL